MVFQLEIAALEILIRDKTAKLKTTKDNEQAASLNAQIAELSNSLHDINEILLALKPGDRYEREEFVMGAVHTAYGAGFDVAVWFAKDKNNKDTNGEYYITRADVDLNFILYDLKRICFVSKEGELYYERR